MCEGVSMCVRVYVCVCMRVCVCVCEREGTRDRERESKCTIQACFQNVSIGLFCV